MTAPQKIYVWYILLAVQRAWISTYTERSMRLTVFTDYGLRILMVLAARRDEKVTIADIAAGFDISDAHLMKVTHALGRTGWVETLRGRGGGMRLAIDPARLTLRHIVATLENDFSLVECLGEGNRCRLTGACGAEKAIGQAMRAFFEELEKYSLADVVARSPALHAVAQVATTQPS
jgi:Rrf2 family transcriptional regulator, nitric oxide-sensitive transcriptional repressor